MSLARARFVTVCLVVSISIHCFDWIASFYPAYVDCGTETGQRQPPRLSSRHGSGSLSGRRYDVCVVGSGLSGAVISERFATEMNHSVLVVEKREHIGGNCYDYIDDETGIRVNLYGAHLFHTNHRRVWEYVQLFSEWTPYEHTVLAAIDGKLVPVPVNIDTVNSLFGANIRTPDQMSEWLRREQVPCSAPNSSEEMALSRVGRRLYGKLFKPYTIKQWSKTPAELGPEVLARIPVRNNYDARYFSDEYQALPSHGYTSMFRRMLAHRLIEVHTSVDYFDVRSSIECNRTFFTGPIDAYFAHLGWEKLEYRSLDFERKVIRNRDYFQRGAVVNHPSARVNYTRAVEYKHFLNQSSPHTVVFYEYSKDGGDPYYPVPTAKNKALYAKYEAMAARERGVTFVGRLANYKYFNMDESILNALELFDREKHKTGSPMADVHIVTNVFNNNKEWVAELCSKLPGVRTAWFVYDKSPVHTPIAAPRGACVTTHVRNIHLPNVGREGHSWLKYMLVPENIGPINVFLQGAPEVDMNTVASAVRKQAPFDVLGHQLACTADRFVGTTDKYFDMPFFSKDLRRLTGALGVDSKKVCYHYRGEFLADGASIRRAVEYWGDVMENIVIPSLETGNDPPMGHALERMWVTLLTTTKSLAFQR